MAMLYALALLACIYCVNGQLDPGNPPDCTANNLNSGANPLSHETYCGLYYVCDSLLNRIAMMCPADMFFDYKAGTCNWANAVQCPNWQCDATKKYPDICCNSYWTCKNDGWEKGECDAGLSFNIQEGKCDGTPCQDSGFCPGQSAPGSSPVNPGTCNNIPNNDGDICKFSTVNGETITPDRPCGAGTSFNASTCTCSDYTSACPPPGAYDITKNKDLDGLCRPSFRSDFKEPAFRAYSDKLFSTPTLLNYVFKQVGVTSSSGGDAEFSPTEAIPKPFFYNYNFNNNDLSTPLAISIMFRYNNPTAGTTFSLINDEYGTEPNNDCSVGRLEADATYMGNSWRIDLRVVGKSQKTARVTNNLAVSPSNFVEVVIQIDATVAMTMIDRGSSGTARGTSVTQSSTTELNGLDSNHCGFVVGRSLNGFVKKYNVYEGCGNFNSLRN